MELGITPNQLTVEQHFEQVVDLLLRKGYAIRNYTPSALNATFITKTGDVILKVTNNWNELTLSGAGLNLNATTIEESHLTLPTSCINLESVILTLIKTKPPTGVTNLSAFVMFLVHRNRVNLGNTLKCSIASSDAYALIQILKQRKSYVFKLLNAHAEFSHTSETNLKVEYEEKELYFKTPAEILNGIVSK